MLIRVTLITDIRRHWHCGNITLLHMKRIPSDFFVSFMFSLLPEDSSSKVIISFFHIARNDKVTCRIQCIVNKELSTQPRCNLLLSKTVQNYFKLTRVLLMYYVYNETRDILT